MDRCPGLPPKYRLVCSRLSCEGAVAVAGTAPLRRQSRALSYSFGGFNPGGLGAGMEDPWPVTHRNTLINVCPQVRSVYGDS